MRKSIKVSCFLHKDNKNNNDNNFIELKRLVTSLDKEISYFPILNRERKDRPLEVLTKAFASLAKEISYFPILNRERKDRPLEVLTKAFASRKTLVMFLPSKVHYICETVRSIPNSSISGAPNEDVPQWKFSWLASY